MRATLFFDGGEWREGVVAVEHGRVRLCDAPAAPGLPRLKGVIVGGFTDHHVHLQLIDRARLIGSRLGRVIDLGAKPSTIAAYARSGVTNAPEMAGGDAHSTPHHTLPSHLSQTPPNAPSDSTGATNAPSDSTGARNAPATASGDAHSTSHRASTSPVQKGWTQTPDQPRIEFAGAFLTPVGGYPSDRSWAPEGSFREIRDGQEAATTVVEMADAGATCIKVASNRNAGPVFGEAMLRAIVTAASAHSLPVVAHAEGAGEAQRMARLGVSTLAHAPFTERLTDGEIEAQATSVIWISTLAIHDGAQRDIAVDNVRRFHSAGGVVRYGTDMGNGPTPVDLNPGELTALCEAGIDGRALLHALAPRDPRKADSVLLLLPHPDADPALARPLTTTDLEA